MNKGVLHVFWVAAITVMLALFACGTNEPQVQNEPIVIIHETPGKHVVVRQTLSDAETEALAAFILSPDTRGPEYEAKRIHWAYFEFRQQRWEIIGSLVMPKSRSVTHSDPTVRFILQEDGTYDLSSLVEWHKRKQSDIKK